MEYKARNIFLLLPVENQVRELDPKLLLASVAALRGIPSVVGSRREIEFHMPSFPRSIYLSKGLKSGNGRFFKILRKMGHQVAAWDEESLVHLPAETYYSRRLSPVAMANVTHLFAWGEDNAELWRRYPDLPPETPIHVTGNPRGDLLRPELRLFYEAEAVQIQREYGNFILVNTNFNHINAFSPFQNLFQPVADPGETPAFGEAAKGMSREYAEGLRAHKQAIFADFKALIPALETMFPDYRIIVRPHPTENPDVYHQIASRCRQVRVTNSGNVVSWLMAAKALVHNGCTTGVEAFAMGVPAISYRATVNDDYDDGFYRLPNRMSHQCSNLGELNDLLGRALAGVLGPPDDPQCRALLDQYLAAQSGPLACERIIDVLESMMGERLSLPGTPPVDRLSGWWSLTRRTWKKRVKGYLPKSINRPEFQEHRYPAIPIEEVRERVQRFQRLLGAGRELSVKRLSDHFFQVTA